MKIFISSPVKGLEEERSITQDTLESLGFRDIFLSESDRSRNKSSFNTCINEVTSSNLFILLLGQYYGWIPENQEYSVTEIEYNKAKKEDLEILIFKLNFFDREPEQNDFIKRVEDFYTGRFIGGEIKNSDELQKRILRDIPQHYVEKSEANKYVPAISITTDKIVEFGKEETFPIKKEISLENPPLFLLKARIHYDKEAGNTCLMKIIINDQELTGINLVNKSLTFNINDGRPHNWYDSQSKLWSLPYSPDFKTNYAHAKYKIINGDPYTSIFNLNGINLKNKDNIAKIIHDGDGRFEAHKNSIIIKELDFIE